MPAATEMKAYLTKGNDGRWILQLRADTTDAATNLKELLDSFGMMADHSPIFIVAVDSESRDTGVVDILTHVYAGPDVSHHPDILGQLQGWNPKERS